MAPVGIVAVVSMNTIMKKNSAMTLDVADGTGQEQALRADEPVGKRAGGLAGRIDRGAQAPAFVQVPKVRGRETDTNPAAPGRSTNCPSRWRSHRPRRRDSRADRS